MNVIRVRIHLLEAWFMAKRSRYHSFCLLSTVSIIFSFNSFFIWRQGSFSRLLPYKTGRMFTPRLETNTCHKAGMKSSNFMCEFSAFIILAGRSGRLEWKTGIRETGTLEEKGRKRASAKSPASTDWNQEGDGGRCKPFTPSSHHTCMDTWLHELFLLVLFVWVQVLPKDAIRLKCVTETDCYVLCVENAVTSRQVLAAILTECVKVV